MHEICSHPKTAGWFTSQPPKTPLSHHLMQRHIKQQEKNPLAPPLGFEPRTYRVLSHYLTHLTFKEHMRPSFWKWLGHLFELRQTLPAQGLLLTCIRWGNGNRFVGTHSIYPLVIQKRRGNIGTGSQGREERFKESQRKRGISSKDCQREEAVQVLKPEPELNSKNSSEFK